MRAEFRHVTQHRHAPALQRQSAQCFQGRDGRIRIGVVTVIQHAHAVHFPKIQTHFRRRTRDQSILNFRAVEFKFRAKRDGKQRIRHLMPSEQIDAILAAKFYLRRHDLKRHATFIKANFLRAPVVLFAKADAHNCRFRPRRNFFRPLVVAVQKQFSVRRQQFGKRTFFLRHARDVAKEFQVLAPDVRDDAKLRCNHFHERREFARMIRARFQSRRLMRFFQPQQRRRHADVIIKTRLAPQRRKFLAQHRRDQFLHRRLAVRTANRDDRQIKLLSISRRKFPQRNPDIIHRHHRARRQFRRQFFLFDDDRRRTFCRDFIDEIVPVKLFTANRKEQIARLRRPRIGADRFYFHARRAAKNFRTAGFSDKFQRAWFHKIISAKTSRSPRR